MKAVIAQTPGNPDVLELRDISPPLVAKGEVKIRVRAFGLNKAESYYRNGDYGTFVPNQALGIEAVGVVVEDPGAADNRIEPHVDRAAIGRQRLDPQRGGLDDSGVQVLPSARGGAAKKRVAAHARSGRP